MIYVPPKRDAAGVFAEGKTMRRLADQALTCLQKETDLRTDIFTQSVCNDSLNNTREIDDCVVY
jgi:hypothetical protein